MNEEKLRDMFKKMDDVNIRLIIAKLQYLQQIDDGMTAHIEADKILCNFISALGYGEIVDEFDKVEKWYD